MKWSRRRSAPAVARGVLERLTAIRLHTQAVRRRQRRADPAAGAEAIAHLDAVEAHVDQAAAQIETPGAPCSGGRPAMYGRLTIDAMCLATDREYLGKRVAPS